MSAYLEFNGAWSLGTSQRSKLFANEAAAKFPGPGNYQMPNFKNKPRSQEVQFAKSRRSINYKNGIPGPTAYFEKGFNFNHLDKQIPIKIAKPHPVQQKPGTIGPGSYDPKPNVESSKSKQPTFSFGYRITQEVVSDTPAPNAYYPENVNTMIKTQSNFGSTMRSYSQFGNNKNSVNNNNNNDNNNNNNNNNEFNDGQYNDKKSLMRRTQSSSVMSRTSKNGFGFAERMKTIMNDVPGPDEYNIQFSKTNNGPTFAKSQRHWIQPSDSPGPGIFPPDNKKQMIKSSSSSNGFSFGQKLHDSLKTYENYVPGPGSKYRLTAYDGDKLKSKLGARFGTEQKHSMVDKESLKKPGPNYYYPIINQSKSEIYIPTFPKTSHQKRIGFSNRPPLSQTGNNPGPGEYFDKEDEKQFGDGPKWKMGARIQKKNKVDIPGPGAYDVQTETLIFQRPKFAYTTGPRSNPVRSEFTNSGPGAYDIIGRLSNNRFGITASERFYNKKNAYEPGPGHYNIGGTIGKIPNYLILSKKKHSQLLDFGS